MGWDVVQIGLKHDLPVDDPIATAKLVAKRMNCNVKLVYNNEYKYNKTKNIVSAQNQDEDEYELIEIAKFLVNNSKDNLRMTSYTYQAKQILKETDIDTLRKAKYTSEDAKSLLNDIDNDGELYEIEYEDVEADLDIRIYRENIYLDVPMDERWWMWEALFHSKDFDRNRLLDSRIKFFTRAKMFGCKELIVCSDQGPTGMIYESLDYSAEQLKQYVFSNQFCEESHWYEPERMESWKKHAKKITFSSVFQDDFKLVGDDFVELIYDDFKDLI